MTIRPLTHFLLVSITRSVFARAADRSKRRCRASLRSGWNFIKIYAIIVCDMDIYGSKYNGAAPS
jgi:hypothetical protein